MFFFHLLKMGFRSSMSLRAAFLLEVTLMAMNNMSYLLLWWLFFWQYDSIRGWKLDEITIMMVIGTGAYGVHRLLFGGLKQLAPLILQGGLDTFILQPKNLLLHIAGTKPSARGIGHLLSTVILLLIAGLSSWQSILLIFVGIGTGALVFTAMLILAHSSAFWLGGVESAIERYTDSLCVFAIYPTHIYSGLLNIIMFTLIPAGVIGYLPVELVREFSWEKLLFLLFIAASFMAVALGVFRQGLKRYESGSIFTVRW